MKKAYKKFKVRTMRRTSRVFWSDLNNSKKEIVINFLYKSRDCIQYFIDFFWQRKDFSTNLANTNIISYGREKMGISSRLAQCYAKQSKETIHTINNLNGSKPWIKKHTITLDSRFVTIEPFNGYFDYAVKLGGSGVPKVILPIHSTKHLNEKLKNGWKIGNSIRLGNTNGKIFVDLFLEKPTPELKKIGKVIGLDSNYKNGLVTSDGQQVGQEGYSKILSFSKRQKHTYKEAKDIAFHAIKKLDLSSVNTLVIEDLRHVRNRTRGKFPRTLNRRLSHWLYASIAERLRQRCEEEGIRLERKDPWKTSQRCAVCGKWDKRSRRDNRFNCVHCGHSDHADFNAAKNLEFLGLAGIYGFRSLENSKSNNRLE